MSVCLLTKTNATEDDMLYCVRSFYITVQLVNGLYVRLYYAEGAAFRVDNIGKLSATVDLETPLRSNGKNLKHQYLINIQEKHFDLFAHVPEGSTMQNLPDMPIIESTHVDTKDNKVAASTNLTLIDDSHVGKLVEVPIKADTVFEVSEASDDEDFYLTLPNTNHRFVISKLNAQYFHPVVASTAESIRQANALMFFKLPVEDMPAAAKLMSGTSCFSIYRKCKDVMQIMKTQMVDEVENILVKKHNQFMCPISNLVMKNPVIAEDGHTYEQVFIQHWLRRSKKSPKTNQPLSQPTLTPNIFAKQTIEENWILEFRNLSGEPAEEAHAETRKRSRDSAAEAYAEWIADVRKIT